MKPEIAAQFPPAPVTLKNNMVAYVRPLRTTDGDKLAEMYAAITWGEYRFFCPYPLNAKTARRNAANADSGEWTTVVIEGPDKKIGGYCWVRRFPETAPQGTFGICIRDKYQNCGAGAAIIKRLLEIVRVCGPATVDLTVQHANERAVILYQKMGFKIVREQTRGTPDDPHGFDMEPEYYMEQKMS